MFLLPVIKNYKCMQNVSLNEWFYLIQHGLWTFMTSVMCIWSFYYIPFADTVVLYTLHPSISAVIACIWLGEKITFVDVILIICTIFGVVIACQPKFIFHASDYINPYDRTLGSVYGLCAALSTAMTVILARNLKRVNSTLVVFTQGTSIAIVSYTLALCLNSFDISFGLYEINWIYFVCYSFFGTAARAFIIFAARSENATMVSTLLCLEIPSAFILQPIFTRIFPTIFSITGGVLVVIGTSLLVGKSFFLQQN